MANPCVLFDLDGTLVDTAPDLARALNAVRGEQGLAPLSLETIRPHASHGSRGLMGCGFDFAEHDPRYEPSRRRLLDIYEAHIARESRLFPGMAPLLDELESRAIRWGVVTNKPSRFTDPLLAALALNGRAACVVSGDTTQHSKPHPEPLLYASRIVGVNPASCLYVGDAERDIVAGRNAGMKTLVALFGYLAPDDRPQDWQADGMVERPQDILDWLGASAPARAAGDEI